MLGIYAAVVRRDLNDWPEQGWQPQERLSRLHAARAFTLGAACAALMEQEIGSLEVGNKADFIVLERDLMQVPEDEFPSLRVEQTRVDGQKVFQRRMPSKLGLEI